MEEQEQVLEKVQKIKESNRGLFFSRVPKQEREWFIKKAEEEFEGDYGMLLKFLVNFYNGLIPENETLQNLVESINALESRTQILESKLTSKEEEWIIERAFDGTELRRKKK